jgi:hypothetical protein
MAGLRSLARFEAGFDVTRRGREGLRVVGRISATVEQTCVVTLEPLENLVEEEIDLTFVPSPLPVSPAQDNGAPVTVADDAPEPLIDGKVDLGALATEFLLLGIDPYPRKPGATFNTPAVAGEAGDRPFAALAALKKGQRSDGR